VHGVVGVAAVAVAPIWRAENVGMIETGGPML
jgi:hypothetical protein